MWLQERSCRGGQLVMRLEIFSGAKKKFHLFFSLFLFFSSYSFSKPVPFILRDIWLPSFLCFV